MRARRLFAAPGASRRSRVWSVALAVLTVFALAFSASATAQAAVLQDTTTTVTATPTTSPAGPGGAISFAVAVAPVTGSGPVVGTGTYTLFGPGDVPIATGSFSAPGAMVSTSGFSAGDYTLKATFTGNSSWGPSSGQATGSYVLAATTTTVTATPTTSPAGPGGAISFAVAVAPVTGSGPVVGTGTYTLFGPGDVPIATGSFSAPGAMVSTSGFSAGDYTLKATFTGNSSWGPSSGQATGTYAAPTTPTTTTLQASPAQAAPGAPITFSATVSGAGGPPSGTVTFKEGSTDLGTGTLTAGVASLTTSALSLGSHTVTAAYGGSSAFTSSTSSPVTVHVTSTPPTTEATLAPTPNASGWFRGPVTTTLKVTPGASGSPVTATYFAIDVPSCGPSSLSTCSTYGAPFKVTGDGVHTVIYFSRDASGAFEAAHTVSVRIDGTRPSVKIEAWPGGSKLSCFLHRGVVLHLTASDPAGSGIARINYQVLGAGRRPPTSVVGSTATASLNANGVSILLATATDLAGNGSAIVRRWVATFGTPLFSVTCTGPGDGRVTS